MIDHQGIYKAHVNFTSEDSFDINIEMVEGIHDEFVDESISELHDRIRDFLPLTEFSGSKEFDTYVFYGFIDNDEELSRLSALQIVDNYKYMKPEQFEEYKASNNPYHNFK